MERVGEGVFLFDEVHHAFGEAAAVIVDLEAAWVPREPVEGFALEIEGFELLLKGFDGDFAVGVAKDDVLYLVVHHPSSIA